MKSQKITPEIMKALRDWRKKEGLSYENIGSLVGLKKAAVGQWFNKETNAIRPSSWSKLYPHIVEYLPKNFQPGALLQIDIPSVPHLADPLTTDLLTQWGKLDRRDKLRVLAFIEQLNEEKSQSVYSSGA